MVVVRDNPPTRLCIVRLSAIGDVCNTVPVVRAIQRALPQSSITWVIGKTEHALLSGLEGVQFVVLDKSRGFRAFLELRQQLAGQHFDLLLHMHASLRANLVSLFVSSKTRLGFDRARARDFQWLFCNKYIDATDRQHVVDGFFEFSNAIGVHRKKEDPSWSIPLNKAEHEFASRYIDDTKPTLVISPCASQRSRNYRNWREERYAQVADYASSALGASVILTGGNTALEHYYGSRICELAESRVVNLIGQTTLKQFLAILERATALVCPDSGPGHMATATGTPAIGLYATSNPSRTGPYLSQHLVVNKYPEAVQSQFNKTVKNIRWGARIRNPGAMDLISVEDVVQKLRQVDWGSKNFS